MSSDAYVKRGDRTRPYGELAQEWMEEAVMLDRGVHKPHRMRVEIRYEGTYWFVDSNYVSQTLKPEDAPQWVRDGVNLLRVLDDYETLPGVGLRYNENVFYIDME